MIGVLTKWLLIKAAWREREGNTEPVLLSEIKTGLLVETPEYFKRIPRLYS